ncbi:longevity-assurance protein [Coprinopsis cinerea okayama7|uniref:Longevity-assurance protein n=1 Tax=Coprinopsis cinerea (strain Okayama-7 / 130 / ATCC MYA-4618 / FGSC 9003) TaxID=240176 RepID=A8NXC2_COPC7|nr:longevity-assurance protein [Coprinopsis cinerea okayama7\|eukprot:XP_001837126.1 longevity-assurance protein [Coprinopsis cinerea okayama7\
MFSFLTQSLWPALEVFTRLSYPTDPPANPDSFPNAPYYSTGQQDIFFIITCIAVMAILRDALRLGVFEPFARWKLMRDLRKRNIASVPGSPVKEKPSTNGHLNGNGHVANGNGHAANGNGKTHHGNGHAANGNGHIIGSGYSSPASLAGKPTTKQLKQVNRSVLRFAEQGWSVVYYTFSWSYGLYVHYHLPTKVLQPSAVWKNYPHIPLALPVKFYYLVQTAFYLHQILILNAEARRKDFWQMMAHHIITVGLLVLSYFTNFTRVGCIILLLMDTCDIFLPLAKMIRYLEVSQLATDVIFGWFMVSWFVTRHFLFILVIWSAAYDATKYIPFVVDPSRGFYLTRTAYLAFVGMLIALQILQCIWFWMICRVAYRVVTGSGAEDTRSDDEIEAE